MAMPIFYCYDDDRSPNIWERWYVSVDEDVQARHDQTWEFLEQRQGNTWREPQTKKIGDLVEVRIATRVEWRVIGYWGPIQGEFTVVMTCKHKGQVYTPREALETAQARMKDIKAGKLKRKSCVRPT